MSDVVDESDSEAQRERDAVLGPMAAAQEAEEAQAAEETGQPQAKPAAAHAPATKSDDGEPAGPVEHEPRHIDITRVRTVAERVLWGLSVLFALVLALAALLIAVDARVENGFVEFVENFAKAVDLGIFSLDNPIKEFTGTSNAETKTALLNYGLGAVFYLIIGRVLERLVRP